MCFDTAVKKKREEKACLDIQTRIIECGSYNPSLIRNFLGGFGKPTVQGNKNSNHFKSQWM